MCRQGCRYKAAGCPEYQNTKLKSITQKHNLYMMILISTVFFFFLSEIYERLYGNCFPAFPQKVLPAPLVCTALHHSHRNPRAEDPMFPQLSARWRWTELHTCCRLPAVLKLLVVPGTIRTCQKFLIRYNKQQLHRMLPKCRNKGKLLFFLVSYLCSTDSFESIWFWCFICRRRKGGAQSDSELFYKWRKDGI